MEILTDTMQMGGLKQFSILVSFSAFLQTGFFFSPQLNKKEQK